VRSQRQPAQRFDHDKMTIMNQQENEEIFLVTDSNTIMMTITITINDDDDDSKNNNSSNNNHDHVYNRNN
jgi:hypothetical protein